MRNRTKALVGGTSVAAVMAAVSLTGGTSAYFYDVQTSANNSITACSIGLEVEKATVTRTLAPTGDVAQSTAAVPADVTQTSNGAILTVDKFQPGEAYKVTVPVKNTGRCDADLWFDFSNHPEADSAFAKTINSTLYATTADNKLASPVTTGTLSQVLTAWPGKLDTLAANGGTDTITFTFGWKDNGRSGQADRPAPAVNDNDFMNQKVTFDMDFALVQEGVSPSGTLKNS